MECLQTVIGWDYYMDGTVSKLVVSKLLSARSEKSRFQAPAYITLTTREQEIMRLLAEGMSIKDIATRLFISHKTVDNHRSAIFAKLDIHSTMDLVR